MKTCFVRHTCYPDKRHYLCCILPGTMLASTGLALFAFAETTDDYAYVHSAWHALMGLSILFFLPPKQKTTNHPSITVLGSLLSNQQSHLSVDPETSECNCVPVWAKLRRRMYNLFSYRKSWSNSKDRDEDALLSDPSNENQLETAFYELHVASTA